ncbi:demethylrebeccamycin-D-glucose O-methyltransferase [Methanobrevibacter oralis]|uniref:Demethylrebeccamycin-D-glucose O-methyltransferase n=2 Tax=Methanobrevibacter oralis TaxID=66851 RepID=A0A166BG77_METOA|nr:class I SAM-dependent methyltransferase [Methanobrevibacter oralis]KZX13304.1 demethylrebeccamycin-D-glucose O-methyltransferase [Methanobrevibacter oralis]
MEKEVITQCRKPHGEEGIKTIKSMNQGHDGISNFAMECIDTSVDDDVLDIGCGGGVNIEKFLRRCPDGNVWGLDYSVVSVSESIKRNQEAVDMGRCQVIEANVCNMPIDDDTFDIVSAFETVYFWPDLANTFKEVLRIIKPGGKFLIGLGTDGNNPEEEEWLATVEGMKIYTKEDLIDYLTVAGFNKIDVFKKENTYIMVLIATKY